MTRNDKTDLAHPTTLTPENFAALGAGQIAYVKPIMSEEAAKLYPQVGSVRPGVKLERQDAHDLIWIRNEFLDYPGLHEKVIVHGHTPAGEAEIMPNRINVDTGAFYSGVLTCAVIDGQDKMLMDVRGAPDLRY